MMLVVDIGNSRIKWAQVHESNLSQQGSGQYSGSGFAQSLDEYWTDLDPPQSLWATNVAGDKVANELHAWVEKRWCVPVHILRATAHACGVSCAYAQPETLGADRWAAMIAAYRSSSSPVCIIDCGTAITIDAMDQGGSHLGGVILPGLGLMRRSLCDNTVDIDTVSEPGGKLLGVDTGQGVALGTLYAAGSAVDRVIEDLEAELGVEVECLITGGNAAVLEPRLTHDCHHQPHLVLQGLAILALEDR